MAWIDSVVMRDKIMSQSFNGTIHEFIILFRYQAHRTPKFGYNILEDKPHNCIYASIQVSATFTHIVR